MVGWHGVCRIPPTAVVTSYTGRAAVRSYSYLLNPTGWGTRSRILTPGPETPEKSQDTPVSNDLTLVLDVQVAIEKLSTGVAENAIDCTVELAPNYWRAVAALGHHQVCCCALAFMLHPLPVNLTL